MIWDKEDSCGYSLRQGYIRLNVEMENKDPYWRWSRLWKFQIPSKIQDVNLGYNRNKIPHLGGSSTQIVSWPGWCCLCKDWEETLEHLFVSFPFTQHIWEKALTVLGFCWQWRGDSFKTTLLTWVNNRETKQYRSLLLLIASRVWITKNKSIFSGFDHNPKFGGRSSYRNSFPLPIVEG